MKRYILLIKIHLISSMLLTLSVIQAFEKCPDNLVDTHKLFIPPLSENVPLGCEVKQPRNQTGNPIIAEARDRTNKVHSSSSKIGIYLNEAIKNAKQIVATTKITTEDGNSIRPIIFYLQTKGFSTDGINGILNNFGFPTSGIKALQASAVKIAHTSKEMYGDNVQFAWTEYSRGDPVSVFLKKATFSWEK